MNKIKKSETEWKKLLDEKTYNITRKSGTEQKIRIMVESNNKELLLECINIVKRSLIN